MVTGCVVCSPGTVVVSFLLEIDVVLLSFAPVCWNPLGESRWSVLEVVEVVSDVF